MRNREHIFEGGVIALRYLLTVSHGFESRGEIFFLADLSFGHPLNTYRFNYMNREAIIDYSINIKGWINQLSAVSNIFPIK
jgi:hypothetical protein